MKEVIFWTIIFSITTSLSIVLLGQRGLLDADVGLIKKIIKLVFDWRFIGAMFLALGARFSFIFLNSAVATIPELEKNATTVAAFASAISFIFIVVANAIFLKERISIQQSIGAAVMLLGLIIILNSRTSP